MVIYVGLDDHQSDKWFCVKLAWHEIQKTTRKTISKQKVNTLFNLCLLCNAERKLKQFPKKILVGTQQKIHFIAVINYISVYYILGMANTSIAPILGFINIYILFFF